jgi:Flp pilus assembly CpaF family ATPase
MDVESKFTTAIKTALLRGDNIGVVSGPAKGKTTLLSTILAEFARLQPAARIVIVEDAARELIPPPHAVQIVGNIIKANLDESHDTYTVSDAIADAMQLDPDALVVGDIRDEATAEAVVRASASRLFFTIHSGSAAGALLRFEQLVGSSEPMTRRMIAPCVQTLVVVRRHDNIWPILEITRVLGVDASGEFMTETVA